ncbi:hypothetical protein BH20ACT3_BH20ACT3_04140 [soil metagenome]
MANPTNAASETHSDAPTKVGSGADRPQQVATAVMVIMLAAVVIIFTLGILDFGWGH